MNFLFLETSCSVGLSPSIFIALCRSCKCQDQKWKWTMQSLMNPDATFGWMVASLRPVSKLLKRESQTRLEYMKDLFYHKMVCIGTDGGGMRDLKTAVTSSSSRSVSRFGLFVMFVQTRTCGRIGLIQEELLWEILEKIILICAFESPLICIGYIVHTVSSQERCQCIVKTKTKNKLEVSCGMTRTLWREEACCAVVRLLCWCDQLLHFGARINAGERGN